MTRRLEQWRNLLEPKAPGEDVFLDWDTIQRLAGDYCFCPAGEKVGFGPDRDKTSTTSMERSEASLAARNKYQDNQALWDLGNEFYAAAERQDLASMVKVLEQIEALP